MNSEERITLNNLQKKVAQHEQTIAQLVKIVATMNIRMEELKTDKQTERQLLVK